MCAAMIAGVPGPAVIKIADKIHTIAAKREINKRNDRGGRILRKTFFGKQLDSDKTLSVI